MIVIVGAGVAGLSCAVTLAEAGAQVRVLEAGVHAGGRVRSLRLDGRVVGELGPSWLWPRWQPIAADWLVRLGIETVAQHDAGEALIDRRVDAPPTRGFLPGQDGIRRVVGGPGAIVDALCARLPEGTLQTRAAVSAISYETGGLIVQSAGRHALNAAAVVVATAPRIALERIAFDPLLPQPLRVALGEAPTWMAQQAKAVAVFDTAFWRDVGLSGRVASQVGPLVEIHDHCGPDGEPAALFGFVGVPAAARRDDDAMRVAIGQQLVRCFGTAAAVPRLLHVEDWALDEFVCSRADLYGPSAHPAVLPDIVRRAVYDDRLRFAAAETATLGPGLLEGAFEAGTRTANALLAS